MSCSYDPNPNPNPIPNAGSKVGVLQLCLNTIDLHADDEVVVVQALRCVCTLSQGDAPIGRVRVRVRVSVYAPSHRAMHQ